MDERDLYKRAIEKWGIEPQIDMTIEELSELITDICHLKRGRLNPYDLYEELADVYIMLDQFKLALNLEDEALEEYKEIKLDRLRTLLGITREGEKNG